MQQAHTRRRFVQLIAGGTLLAAGRAAAAEPARIARLIKAAQSHARISQRIDFISSALLGLKYQAHTLIGGPNRPEVLVVREDAFDCVTYCETVLAAALVKDVAAFQAALRRIRYDRGQVAWDRRNHYFAEWGKRNVENGICRRVPMEPAVDIDKTVSWYPNLGRRQVSMRAIPRATLMANRRLLTSGDIIGFVSQRPSLDFYHTGFVVLKGGAVMLRHASQSRGRVIEETMDTFIAVNGVQYVTLLRAADPDPAPGAVAGEKT